jgi:O-acetyl-ADP-ribose deacetylase (regulator of RNase III)
LWSGDFLLEAVNEDVIVSAAVHFGESHSGLLAS